MKKIVKSIVLIIFLLSFIVNNIMMNQSEFLDKKMIQNPKNAVVSNSTWYFSNETNTNVGIYELKNESINPTIQNVFGTKNDSSIPVLLKSQSNFRTNMSNLTITKELGALLPDASNYGVITNKTGFSTNVLQLVDTTNSYFTLAKKQFTDLTENWFSFRLYITAFSNYYYIVAYDDSTQALWFRISSAGWIEWYSGSTYSYIATLSINTVYHFAFHVYCLNDSVEIFRNGISLGTKNLQVAITNLNVYGVQTHLSAGTQNALYIDTFYFTANREEAFESLNNNTQLIRDYFDYDLGIINATNLQSIRLEIGYLQNISLNTEFYLYIPKNATYLNFITLNKTVLYQFNVLENLREGIYVNDSNHVRMKINAYAMNNFQLNFTKALLTVFYFNYTIMNLYVLNSVIVETFDMDLFIELILFVMIVGLIMYTLKQYPNSQILIGIWIILLLFYLGISLLISQMPIAVIIIIFTFLIVILLLHLSRLMHK